jgi:hypothetical protein
LQIKLQSSKKQGLDSTFILVAVEMNSVNWQLAAKQEASIMKKVFLLLLVFVVALSLSAYAGEKMGKAKNVAGWVSDEKCGAKGANAGGAECTKKCIEGGQKVVFVTDKGKKVLNVDNPDALKGHEGHHVTVNGHVNDANGSIHVESVKMMKEKAAKAAS